MAIDLNKLSDALEDALERARMLAEQRQQAFISPAHILYVLLDKDDSLVAMLERAGVARAALLDSLATQFNGHERQLEPGKRPVASQALRNLIEKSFEKMSARGAETVSPFDFVLAAIDSSEEDLKSDLRDAGITKQTVEKALEARESTSATLDQPAARDAPKDAAAACATLDLPVARESPKDTDVGCATVDQPVSRD